MQVSQGGGGPVESVGGLTPCSLTDSGLFEGLMPTREQTLRTLSLLLLLLISLLI